MTRFNDSPWHVCPICEEWCDCEPTTEVIDGMVNETCNCTCSADFADLQAPECADDFEDVDQVFL